MKRLSNKQIILGISGSIAAYKACELVRLLRDSQCQVRVVMTQAATEFVSPLTFQALSHNEVYRDLLNEKAEAAMGHIELARWADAVVVVPASANFISRLAQGRADDLLSTVCLASNGPIAVAPAMNQQMWQDSITQENISRLTERGIHVFGPAYGDQACGDIGPGRMLEPEQLLEHITTLFTSEALSGSKVLVTAGPTREFIDPVRFISNRSSGAMGYAIANAAIEAGAQCTLISGPTQLETPNRVNRIDVTTAQQMHDAVMAVAEGYDIFIGCAAVADYRPAQYSKDKIKKDAQQFNIAMIPNPDILTDVGHRFPKLFRVGFAAETSNIAQHARHKLQHKALNIIIANNVGRDDIGFDSADNEVDVYWQSGETRFAKAPKAKIARQLVQLIAQQFNDLQTAHP